MPLGFRGLSTPHLHGNTTTWEKNREHKFPLQSPAICLICARAGFLYQPECAGEGLRSSHKLKKQSAQGNLLPGVRVYVPGLGHLLRSDQGRNSSLLKVLSGKH